MMSLNFFLISLNCEATMLGAQVATKENFEYTVRQAASAYGVPVALIKATIKQESDWKPSAYRREPAHNDASWGLMQVMLGTAKEVTKNKDLTASQLMQPEFNIYVGTKFLGQLLKKYGGNLKHVIASYNAGSPRFDSKGNYVNQGYVNSVYNNFLFYQTMESVRPASKVASYILPLLAVGAVGIVISRR